MRRSGPQAVDLPDRDQTGGFARKRTGMLERAIYQRTKEVFEHFHLPFEAEAPEG